MPTMSLSVFTAGYKPTSLAVAVTSAACKLNTCSAVEEPSGA